MKKFDGRAGLQVAEVALVLDLSPSLNWWLMPQNRPP